MAREEVHVPSSYSGDGPEGNTEEYSKDDWKLYFFQARKFLVSYTRDTMQAAVAQAVIDRGPAVPQSAEQEERLQEAGKDRTTERRQASDVT